VAFENSAALRIPIFPNTTSLEALDIVRTIRGRTFHKLWPPTTFGGIIKLRREAFCTDRIYPSHIIRIAMLLRFWSEEYAATAVGREATNSALCGHKY
jgi:hypothetical protein